MPIFRFRSTVLYFAHVPKCGGTSVEAYLSSIGKGSVAFRDANYFLRQLPVRWTVSSPQHVDGLSLALLFPPDFFDDFVAVVRDPVRRFISGFLFQKHVAHTIAGDVSADDFARALTEQRVGTLGWMDNHFMPQCRFLYPGRPHRIFKLEQDGLGALKSYLDTQLFGAPLAFAMPHANPADKLLEKEGGPDAVRLSAAALRTLASVYAEDCDKLGYRLDQNLTAMVVG